METLALPTAVLEDLQWLQRLAAMLARDADDADDLVQETLVEAWRDPPPDTSRPLRPWLGAVLRNRLRMRRRGQLRRAAREQQAPAVSAEPRTPDREHERLEVLRILLTELQALSEEDQRIIVRRFFEGESAADIGRALDIPSATIRSRIHRSLGRLRSSLDRRFGARETWCAAVIAMPPTASMAPTASNAGSSSTMSITMKALLITALGGTTGIVGWAIVTPEPKPEPEPTVARKDASASAGPTASSEPPRPTIEDAKAQADDPRAQWQRRRDGIRSRLPPASAGAPPAAPSGTDARTSAAHDGFVELVDACMEDLETEATGAVTLSMRELGAPGVGTIYDSVEIVDATFRDPEVLECLTQSMYAWVGAAPEQPYEHEVSWTMTLGSPPAGSEKEAQTFGFIVGAHLGEVRFCESKAEGPVAGAVTVGVTIGAAGKPESVEAEPSTLPPAVVECIVGATQRWIFPTTLAGKRFTRDFVLPVPGKPAGPATED